MTPSFSPSRLSATDAAFLYLERKEVPLHIASVCVFDGPIPFREFVERIDAKLEMLPRYRQIPRIPQWDLEFPTWEDDPKFDVRRHIIPVTLPAPGGEAELQEFASRILSQVLERDKPLWDVHVISGLKDGRGAMIWRLHHALADGVSGAELMKLLLDPTPEFTPIPKTRRRKARAKAAEPPAAKGISDTINSTLGKLLNLEAGMLGFAEGLFANGKPGGAADPKTKDSSLKELVGLLPEFTASIERLPFNKPCTGKRVFRWAEFPMSDVRAVREAAGGTVNDVILGVLTRALTRYVKLHGQSVVNRFVRIVCPVSLRTNPEDASMGNQISFLPVALPLDAHGPVRTLQAVTARTETLKRCGALSFVGWVTKWLSGAPPALQALFWRNIPEVILPVPLLNMICTNVMGSATPLYAAGRRMLAAYPQVPTGWDLGVGCAAHSYDGKLFFGLIADTHAAPDVDRLRDFLVLSFHELRRSAALKKVRGNQKREHQVETPQGQPSQPVPAGARESARTDAPPAGDTVAVAAHSKEAA